MSRGVWVRFFLVLGLLGGCLALAINVRPNLGLDLKGGAQFVFQAEGTEQVPANAENVDKTLQVLRGRVDALGVAESTLVRQGENRILVELPGVTSDEEAQEAEERIGTTAKLTIHEVLSTAEVDTEPTEDGNQVLPSDQGDTLEVGPTVIQGDEITGASAVQRDQSVESGSWRSTSTARPATPGPTSPARPPATRRRPEATRRDRARRRGHHLAGGRQGVGCDVGIRGGSTDITGNFTSGTPRTSPRSSRAARCRSS